MNKDAKEITDQIKNKHILIFEAEKRIKTYKEDIKILKKDLFKKCQHEWIYDECTNFDDRCKYICKFCRLYRNPNYN